MYTLKRTNNLDPDFKLLVKRLDQDLLTRYGAEQALYDAKNIIENNQTVVVAYLDNAPVGCGCFKAFDNSSVELKRMFVHDDARGKGIASAILTELEHWAKEIGYKTMVLETGNKQQEAIALYLKHGYYLTEQYGEYIGMPSSLCYSKQM